ncbi:MAG TPA: ABC transporter permease [Flavilitoribacter sp.]|nr:ABC transporter permease [Flavilitoribacter sp.]HMQ90208.1 ABC transporter permease [Flavilitoribacter sp.]
MRADIIKTIYRKELKEVLRDKRMIYLVILLPFFLYPVLFTIIGKVGASQSEKMAAETVTLLANPEAEGTPVLEAVRKVPGLEVKVRSFDRAELDTLDQTMGLIVAPDFRSKLDSNESASVQLLVNESKDVLDMRANAVRAVVNQVNEQLLNQRLTSVQLDEKFIKPIELESVDLASKEAKAGKILASFLPMIILLFIFIGCVYISIDITAGEKERRTLQTLFTTPATTREIIAGKFGAVMTVGVVSAFMNVASLVVAILIQVKLLGGNIGFFSLSIDPQGWMWIGILILLSTIFLAGLTLAVVLLANSYKEAQSYVSPMMMLVLIPTMISQMPGMELTSSTALVPMLNIALSIGAILKGTFSPALVGLVALMALLYAALALYLASLTFGNENVITGEKVSMKKLLARK